MDLKINTKQVKFFGLVFAQLIVFSVAIGIVLRIILMFHRETEDTFSIPECLQFFAIGFINDICMGIILCLLMWLNLSFMSQSKYQKPWGYIILAIIVAGLVYSFVPNSIFHQYGGVVPDIAHYFLIYKAISFGLRLLFPKIRENWSKISFSICFYLYVLCILINAVSEYFFWNEFGVRYNFIAVDYLVYTNEVIGNIFESYPIIPMFVVLATITLIMSHLFLRKSFKKFDISQPITANIVPSLLYFASLVVACIIVNFTNNTITSSKIFVNELQANGAHKFYLAFMNSTLDYNTFYLTLNEKELCDEMKTLYGVNQCTIKRHIRDSLPDIQKNIVLITIESMSASFLEHYGNGDKVTPNLDKLINQSLVFDRMYATGNRTVRGLEAVTLSLPPCPGESLIKQPNNGNLHCTGEVLRQKGYRVQYLYGGDSSFDNMETFFGGNGYEIVDKRKIKKEDITFQNIWGVCDGDLFDNAITVFNTNSLEKKPFFAHIMTTSNHRPFTYPEGKIDIPSDSQTRNGGVKYTDFALGEFIRKAKEQAWFKNTIFVITADHCASSAGKTSIPLDKYQIPALIYAPDFVHPQHVDKLVSQIDLMPTVFGLLHLSYDSYFYGKDILSNDYNSRAFVATYQDLGYWEENVLTVLSPTRKVNQYDVVKQNNSHELSARQSVDSTLMKKAIMYYQSAHPYKIENKQN